MTKFIQTISIALMVAVTLCSASPSRLDRVKPSKSKFLARQEVAVDVPAQTPYPPAGIRPEIPFNLPTDEKLVAPVNYYLPPLEDKPAKFYSPPAQVYGPPAETYGPPEVSVKDDAEEIAQEETVQQPEEQPEEQAHEEAQPDEVQSEQSEEVAPSPQPEVEQQGDAEAESEQVEPAAVEDPLPQRLVKAKNSLRKGAQLRSAKLQLVPARRQAVAAPPVFLGSLYAYNGQLYRL